MEGVNQYVYPYIERKNWNLRHKSEESTDLLTEEARLNIHEH